MRDVKTSALPPSAAEALRRLPATTAVPELSQALEAHGAAVFSAPPGAGKTTAVPLCLLEEPWLAGQGILVLEPRRVAARAAARRMASLLGEKTGQRVGYQVRFDRKAGPHTRIEVLTEGILTARLQSDPAMTGIGLVVFDEFHERSLQADLALALSLEARGVFCPELRILLMSATMDTAPVARLLGDAPVVEAGGRPHPVEIQYAERPTDPERRTDLRAPRRPLKSTFP